MPLPTDVNQVWPPKHCSAEYKKFEEWSAWYSGDPERLQSQYAFGVQQPSYNSSPWAKFWGRIGARPAAQKAQFHVPMAGDLSSISSALLFGVRPRVRIPEAHEPQPGVGEPLVIENREAESEEETPATGDPTAIKAEDRLRTIIKDGGVFNRLLEAAESASALGGVFLVPAWDKDLAEVPLVTVVQADSAVPYFKMGMLNSVCFYREIERADNVVIRHLELHERQVGKNSHILNALYRGGEHQLGARLDDAALREFTGLEPEVLLPFPELDAEYIPNMRPNKLWRGSALGLSDYSGAEGLFDALDEVYASWIRDIRLAKARIIVPKEFIDEFGAFDIDHEVFTRVNMEPALGGQAMPMLAQQFAIRHQEYLATALEFVERIVSNAGYSPQTYGLHIMGRAESGTALRMRENRTMMTMERKSSWWGPALERLFTHLLIIDQQVFESGISPMGVEVELSDAMVRDPVELAQTANVLKQAMAASTQERVRMTHPDWTPEEIAAEVARILDEAGTSAPTVSVAPGGPTAPEAAGSPPVPPSGPEATPGGPMPAEMTEPI